MSATLDVIREESLQQLDGFAKGLSQNYDEDKNLVGVKNFNSSERNLSIAVHVCMKIYAFVVNDLQIKIKGVMLHENCALGENDFVYILDENGKSNARFSEVYDFVVRTRKVSHNLECMFVEDIDLNKELLKADGYKFEFSFEL